MALTTLRGFNLEAVGTVAIGAKLIIRDMIEKARILLAIILVGPFGFGPKAGSAGRKVVNVQEPQIFANRIIIRPTTSACATPYAYPGSPNR